jgi:hypothetical protein
VTSLISLDEARRRVPTWRLWHCARLTEATVAGTGTTAPLLAKLVAEEAQRVALVRGPILTVCRIPVLRRIDRQ